MTSSHWLRLVGEPDFGGGVVSHSMQSHMMVTGCSEGAAVACACASHDIDRQGSIQGLIQWHLCDWGQALELLPSVSALEEQYAHATVPVGPDIVLCQEERAQVAVS
jgi:hypothetical protein